MKDRLPGTLGDDRTRDVARADDRVVGLAARAGDCLPRNGRPIRSLPGRSGPSRQEVACAEWERNDRVRTQVGRQSGDPTERSADTRRRGSLGSAEWMLQNPEHLDPSKRRDAHCLQMSDRWRGRAVQRKRGWTCVGGKPGDGHDRVSRRTDHIRDFRQPIDMGVLRVAPDVAISFPRIPGSSRPNSDNADSPNRIKSTKSAPLGIRTETCGLRDRSRGVQSVLICPLTCGYVLTPSVELSASRPRIAEIVGRIVGKVVGEWGGPGLPSTEPPIAFSTNSRLKFCSNVALRVGAA